MRKYLKLIRVRHYIKNGLVFAALACSGQLLVQQKFLDTLIGFIAFCAVATTIYIINDIRDLEKDRNHPVKCKRPIASGEISVTGAWIAAVLSLGVAIICNALVFNWISSAALLLYLIINLGYSFGLKNYPLVDVTILSSGFLLRVVYGAFISDIKISNWLYLTVIVAAFYFALGKRRNELKFYGNSDTRKVLKSYTMSFLEKSMNMCLTLANAFYALWSMDENTVSLYNGRNVIFTVPIVMLITMKYSLDIEGESDGDPVEVIFRDKILLGLCFIYILLMVAILYL